MEWTNERLQDVERDARECPDACGQDVISLVAEVRRLKQMMVTIVESGVMEQPTTKENPRPRPDDKAPLTREQVDKLNQERKPDKK